MLLLFLSPVMGELLSGAAPPAEFFNVFTLIHLSLVYGGGAILIRETALRWNKGWLSIFILGMAYGIIEEGLMIKSFFDPSWGDLGPFSSYGRWLGVNWVWAVYLTIYHGVISISIPICLVNLIFPKYSSEKWISNRKFVVLQFLFIITIVLSYFFLFKYNPPLIQYVITLLITGELIILARVIPYPVITSHEISEKKYSPLWFGFIGFFWVFMFYLM